MSLRTSAHAGVANSPQDSGMYHLRYVRTFEGDCTTGIPFGPTSGFALLAMTLLFCRLYCVGMVLLLSVGAVMPSGILKPRMWPFAAVSVMSPPMIWFLYTSRVA